MQSSSRRAYPLLTDVLRLLPVQPFREREELGLARHRAGQSDFGEVRGVRLPAAHLDELFVQDGSAAPRVSPSGARMLLELFRSGALERTDRSINGGIELLEAYAQGRASIVGLGYWKKPRPRKATVLASARPTSPVSHTGFSGWLHEPRYRITTHRLT
jgi:hypothetical protein